MNNTESTSTDKNLWIAVALSIGVYALWFTFVDKKSPVSNSVPVATATPSSIEKPTAASPKAPAKNTPQDSADTLASAEQVMIGESPARINPRGAAIVSYLFKGPVSPVELVSDPRHGLFATFPDSLFIRDRSAKGIVYTTTLPNQIKISKEFIPGQGTVLPRLVINARNQGNKMTTLDSWAITAGPGLGTVASEQKENQSTTRTIGLTPESAGLKGRIETLKAGVHNGPYRWIGIDNRYFLAALMPSFEHFQPMVSSDPSGITLTSKAISLKPGGTFTWEVPYYLGPKGHSWLSHYGVGLERAIDFGFFSQIGRMMLVALLWLHGHIGNWGWSIIVLTLALQILLMPMTYKSLKAAAAMRKVQPEVTKLQQRYKDDPTRLNTEMMALYKNAGANPLGGCLPMLAQMPIFIALYNALRNSWELHGASWMFWIHDLSAKDPFYILPVVMGGLMFLQSKLNPPAGDPTQQQMMMFMPLIFTFMFLKFPSGLVLYWLTNSLVSTIMQLALRNHLDATA